jgi:carbamoyl-phosphate synthase small subunit
MNKIKGKLILSNEMEFEGYLFGYTDDCVGEAVFNTGMSGYQEILTDPSYYGQIVTLTFPLIGNYGINFTDLESKSVKVRGFVVNECCNEPSNFRNEMTLEGYLKEHKITGIKGIDTRKLTKVIRSSNNLKAVITKASNNYSNVKNLFDEFSNKDSVYKVSTKEIQVLNDKKDYKYHIACMDFGMKENIKRNFLNRDCKLTIFPANTKADDILKVNPDLIFLSNGPGDPNELKDIIEQIKILSRKKPICGICLGHQLLAHAFDGDTAKLEFGHRGSNHPVKDLEEDKIYITSQNHGYYVSKVPESMKVTHISLNDNSVEGFRHKTLPIFSVQYHPEASPGPHENTVLFDKFLDLIK